MCPTYATVCLCKYLPVIGLWSIRPRQYYGRELLEKSFEGSTRNGLERLFRIPQQKCFCDYDPRIAGALSFASASFAAASRAAFAAAERAPRPESKLNWRIL